MNSPKVGLRVAAVIFGLVGLVHLWRILVHVPVNIGTVYIQMRFSLIAALVAGALCIWIWMLSGKIGRS